MSLERPRVVIADLNEDYAVRLEDKFLRMLRSSVDLDVITDAVYFQTFFSAPVHVDVALISEELVQTDLANHDIEKLFVLSEDVPSGDISGGPIRRIYKYTSLSHVFNQTMGDFAHLARSRSTRQSPKTVVFFSPVGGSGKTTLAAGTAASLQESGFKVLFVDAEYQQEMGDLFDSVSSASNRVALALVRALSNPYPAMREHIIHDVVDVLPPLSANIITYGITFDALTAVVEGAMRSGDYDYVVVDTDSSFSPEKFELVQMADVIVVPARQGLISARKTKSFLDGLDTSGRGKCHVVCNFFRQDELNVLSELVGGDQVVEAYLAHDRSIQGFSAEELAARDDVAAVTYLVR